MAKIAAVCKPARLLHLKVGADANERSAERRWAGQAKESISEDAYSHV